MKKVVFTFGRMNPPTIGHEKLVNKLKAVASKEKADARLYLSHTNKPGSDPLSYNDKIKFAQKAFGIAYKSSAKQIFQIIKEFQDQGYTDIIMVVGSDRVKEFQTLFNKYKGDYDFDSIKVVSAGQRDPDATGVEGMSGTKLRNLAKDGDMKTFISGLASKLSVSDKKKIYALVSKNMKEAYFDIEMDNILTEAPLTVQQRIAKGRVMKRLAPKMARARAKAAKRMAAPRQLKMRAQKAAIVAVRKKVAGDRGINYNNLSPNDKIAVDKLVAKKQGLVAKIAKKMLPIIRKKEQARLKALHSKTEGFDISEEAEISLRNKASKSDISYETIKEVYDRGLLYWEENYSMNEQQYAFARVNSFLSGGKSSILDVDLITEEITKKDLDQIEKYADKIFAAVGIDVEFTRHFMDRVNDPRNKKPITPAELIRLFKQSYKKYGKKIAKLGPDAEAVINDMKTNINMPFVLNLKGQELELVAKTVMRKKDFKTSGDKLTFESLKDACWPDYEAIGTKKKNGKTVPNCVPKEEDLDEMSWYKKVLSKIDQVMHPTGYEKITKAYVDGMKDKEHQKHPSAWAADIAREHGIPARSIIAYINKLVSKGILPKNLKAGDSNMIKSFKTFDIEEEVLKKKSSADRIAAKKKKDKWAKTSAGKKSALKSKKRSDKIKSGAIKVDKARSKTAKKSAKLYSSYIRNGEDT